MDVDDDDNDTDTDDFDDDDGTDPACSTIMSSRCPSGRRRDGFFQEQEEAHRAHVRSRFRVRGIDASTVMLTGDPVRMYLKEIGKVDLLTPPKRSIWP